MGQILFFAGRNPELLHQETSRFNPLWSKAKFTLLHNPVGASHANRGVNFLSLALGVWPSTSCLFVCLFLSCCSRRHHNQYIITNSNNSDPHPETAQ